jgi:uncharacterized protein (UPF0212 family)
VNEYGVPCNGEGTVIEYYEFDYIIIEAGDRCNCPACCEQDEYFEERLTNYFD